MMDLPGNVRKDKGIRSPRTRIVHYRENGRGFQEREEGGNELTKLLTPWTRRIQRNAKEGLFGERKMLIGHW
jgi:hypothetical protein